MYLDEMLFVVLWFWLLKEKWKVINIIIIDSLGVIFSIQNCNNSTIIVW